MFRQRSRSSVGDNTAPNAHVRARSRSFVRPTVSSASAESSPGGDSSHSPLITPEPSPRPTAEDEARAFERADEALVLLASNPKLCSAVLNDDLGDSALHALCRVLSKSGRLLPLIRDHIQMEFLQHASDPDSILRGNCTATRLMSAYSSHIGGAWLCKTLRHTVKLLLQSTELWIVDPSKGPPDTPEAMAERAARGRATLSDVATRFLNRLRRQLDSTPPAIRCMVYMVWLQARTFVPERTAVLLGGFLFLRIFNPAIISPDLIPGLLRDGDARPGATYKHNAVQLSKVLQHLSNNKLFSEVHMECVNEWLSSNMLPLETFLLDVATDKDVKDGSRPFAALLAVNDVPPGLRAALSQEQWNALHVSLMKSETHLLVSAKLGTIIGAADGPLSPIRGGSSSGSGSSGAVAHSLPTTPTSRSRSGSSATRIRGDSEDLSVYSDGKIRVRAQRRGSMSNMGLFATTPPRTLLPTPSAPSSPASGASPAPERKPDADVPSTASDTAPRAERVPSIGRERSPSFIKRVDRTLSFGSDSDSVSVSRAERSSSIGGNGGGALAGSHRMSARLSSSGSLPILGQSANTAGAAAEVCDTWSQRPEVHLFALLKQIPLPPELRKERFQQFVDSLHRERLVSEGLLSERGRGSVKLVPGQLDAVLRLARALSHDEFGLLLNSFTPTMAGEWMARWIHVTAEKDVDHLLSLMVRSSFLIEKGSKAARGYQWDMERVNEMARLIE